MVEINFKTHYRYIIGIDPDVYKNGFAVFDTSSQQLVECTSLDYDELTARLAPYKSNSFVRLEAGWLVKKSNWKQRVDKVYIGLIKRGYSTTTAKDKASLIAQRQSKNVGENHGSGKIIHTHLIKNDYDFELVKPCGASSFFKSTIFFKKQTGWSKRTNNDARSAAALCYKY